MSALRLLRTPIKRQWTSSALRSLQTSIKRPWTSWLWLFCALAFAAIAVTLSIHAGAFERNTNALSPLDEAAHYDYVLKLQDGSIPRWGQRIEQDTILEMACLPSIPGVKGNCKREHRDPGTAPAAGFSYEVNQTPLGYLPFMLTVNRHDRPAQAIHNGRWGGVIWAGVAAALLILYAALEALPLLSLAALLLICLLNPVAVLMEASVTSESVCVTVGVLTLLAARFLRRNRKLWVQLAAGIAAGIFFDLISGTAFVAALGVALTEILVDTSWRTPRPRKGEIRRRIGDMLRRNAGVIALLVGTVFAFELWAEIQAHRAIVSPSIVGNALMGFAIGNTFSPLAIVNSFPDVFSLFSAPAGTGFYGVWNVAVLGGVVALALVPASGLPIRAWASSLGALITLCVLATLIPILWWLQGHFVLATPVRYGLPIIPLIGVALISTKKPALIAGVGVVLPVLCLVAQHYSGQL